MMEIVDMMDSCLLSKEAKQQYFLNADDLKGLPRETLYDEFGTGRPMWMYRHLDLRKAAIAKYGEEGYAKKVAARTKRLENKRKREEAQAAAEVEKENQRQAAIAADPKLAEKERRKKQKADEILQRNLRIAGGVWELTITEPESVAGTDATLQIKELPPMGIPGDAEIGCHDLSSPAYSHGNIHGFKGKSSEHDAEMVFETKWKVLGMRHTGTIRVKVLPSDKVDAKEDSLMVKGEFDSGVNDGVRHWTFTGYRD